jgi:uncharacterized protein (DUF433 family)
MLTHYVDQHDGGYWIAGTRISLDSIVYAFLEGLSPESIVDSFETLTLEQVYGVIAYYLGHKATIRCLSKTVRGGVRRVLPSGAGGSSSPLPKVG